MHIQDRGSPSYRQNSNDTLLYERYHVQVLQYVYRPCIYRTEAAPATDRTATILCYKKDIMNRSCNMSTDHAYIGQRQPQLQTEQQWHFVIRKISWTGLEICLQTMHIQNRGSPSYRQNSNDTLINERYEQILKYVYRHFHTMGW